MTTSLPARRIAGGRRTLVSPPGARTLQLVTDGAPAGRSDATPPTGEQRIAAAFAAARDAGRSAALMPFLMGGFPSARASRSIAEAYVDNGADLVEIGIPCCDAPLDGPVIRAAGSAALRAGATVDTVLDIARAVSARVPVIVMCYWSVAAARGARRFADDLRDAGVSGLIVPDLPPDAHPEMQAACDADGVVLVGLVSPTTPDGDIACIGRVARGFLYSVSATGTTGERAALASDAGAQIRRVKDHSSAPVALGFGISTPAHAAQAARAGADGVIVGSRLVRAAAESADPATAAGELVALFSTALTPAIVDARRCDVPRRAWRERDPDLAQAA